MSFRRDDPLLGVLSPPRAERFRERLGLAGDAELSCDFSGWSKLVVLEGERAWLFPRDHEHVEPLRREVEALEAVAPAGLDEVPRVLEVLEDVGLGPYPVVAISRRPGCSLESVLDGVALDALLGIAARVGALAARWHAVDPKPLAQRGHHEVAHRAALDELLGTRPDAAPPLELARSVVDTLGLAAERVVPIARALERARALPRVLVHSDLHEGQLLVDPQRGHAVTGVIDWQTAWVDHPLAEFDLCEWGPTIWRQHRSAFPRLRAAYWSSYAQGRGLEADLGAAFEAVHACAHALQLARGRPGAHVFEDTGTPGEAAARAAEACAALPHG